jgi:hypothetical protein
MGNETIASFPLNATTSASLSSERLFSGSKYTTAGGTHAIKDGIRLNA